MSSKTIKDFYPRHKTLNGDVGIEVEVEFAACVSPLVEIGGAWRVVEDHSLRNGMEYVTRAPIKEGPDKLGKIKFLTDTLNKHALNMSHRTSVHVHRNIMDFTPIEVWNTVLAYWILEAPLLAFCGPQRRGNLFCLGVHEASGILNYCYTDLDKDLPFASLTSERCKYGGQNLNAISRLGSIEYRGMRGTTDPDLINLWSSTLYHIGERARAFKDPAALMDFYLDSEKDQFLFALLPIEFIQHIKGIQEYVKLIRRNVEGLVDLAYYHEDWAAWQAGLKEPKPTKSKIEAYMEASMTNFVATTGQTPASWTHTLTPIGELE